jgi:hypothetical protein
VPGCQGDSLAVISENRQAIPLTVAVSGVANSVTENVAPQLSFDATSSFTPNAPAISGIYYQVDTWMGDWLPVSPAGASGTATLAALTPGEHVVYAFAIDGHEAASNASSASSTLVGTIASYPVVVTTAPEPAAAAITGAALAVLAALARRARC